MVAELLAQLLEMQSVVAADRRIAEPVKIPRPGWMTADGGTTSDGQPRNPFTAAIQRMMAVPAPGAAA